MSGADGGWVVLDVDDTIVDTYHVGFQKCAEVARILGLAPLTVEEYGSAYGAMSFAECVTHWYGDIDVGRFQTAYDRLADRWPPRPLCDLPAFVQAVKAGGFRVGVLTNGPGDKTLRKLAVSGIAPADVDFVHHAGNSPVAKPAPAAFDALRAVGVEPARAWYVSDSPDDWAGANSAGFRTIGVVAGVPHGGAARVVPDLVVPGLDALLDAFEVLRPSALAPPSRERVEAVSFDAGFTLVDDRTPPAVLMREELGRHGVVVGEQEVGVAIGAWAHLLDGYPSWAGDDTIATLLHRFYRQVLDALAHPDPATGAREVIDRYTRPSAWRARPAAKRVLHEMREVGFRVGVFSNWQSTLSEMLDVNGLSAQLDFAISSARIGFAKPDPSAFRAVAASIGTRPANLVHVGDDVRGDALGILRAGGRAVLVPRDAAPGVLEQAVTVVARTGPIDH